MTKIEKLLMEGKEYENNLLLFNRVNRLIDKVNQQEEQIKALQKKLVDFDHVTDSGKKVGVGCKCGRDDVCTCGAKVATVEEDTSGKINEGLDRVFGEEKQCERCNYFEGQCGCCEKCGAYRTSQCKCEDRLVPDEVMFVKQRGTSSLSLYFDRKDLYYNKKNDGWGVGVWNIECPKHMRVKCRLLPCKLEDVKVGEWVYANYELCLDEQDKYYLCIGDKLFCYIDEGVKEIAWGAMTNNLNVHYLYKVQPIE